MSVDSPSPVDALANIPADMPGDGPAEDNDGSINDDISETCTCEEDMIELAKLEQKWVFWLRSLTTLILWSVAVGVCFIVYFQGRHSEKHDFEQDFVDLGEKLGTSFQGVFQQRFGIIESFAQDMTSQANDSWPFFTPPDFAQRGEKISLLAQLMFFFLLPIVTKENRPAWDAYSVANQGWRAEGIAHEKGIPLEEVNANPIFKNIMNVHYGGPPKPQDTAGPYFPIWCLYPADNRSIANIDMYGDWEHREAIDTVIKEGKPAIEVSYDYWDPEKERDNRHEMMMKNRHMKYLDDPHAFFFFPIFERNRNTKTVAAMFMAIIYWRTYFDDLLPPGADGIIVVLENTCDQQYTYQVDGIHSYFIGHGDLHDPKYDYLETGTSLVKDEDGALGQEGCLYGIRVFPSQQFEDNHYTKQPLFYSVALAGLFLFTTGVFALYDYMVERRQRIVMTSARQSGALVNNLFPEVVRDRMYEEQQQANANTQLKGHSARWETKGREGNDTSMIVHKEAIASLYLNTTVFFADLAGFTKWSSSRTPEEVFQLLETIYGEFDGIAIRRRVFKIETIGDCYVAVTGIPKPQEDHAVVMCRFAADCMAKMNVMVASLADRLGEDTSNLAMRVGLHSGPVTGGVLRGQKARFQLFGDTVNTASRMESNGVARRIHVSPTTAEALISRGKQAWLTPREEKIVAKGKGEMQTYWVNVLVSKTGSAETATTKRTSEDLKN